LFCRIHKVQVDKIELAEHEHALGHLDLVAEIVERYLDTLVSLEFGQVTGGAVRVTQVEPRVPVKHVEALLELAQQFERHVTLVLAQILKL
jgi:hypothetical protein